MDIKWDFFECFCHWDIVITGAEFDYETAMVSIFECGVTEVS